MFIFRSGSIGLLSLLLVACSQPQTTSHQMAQPARADQSSVTSAGLSDTNPTPETRVLYTHLQNIKHKHSLFGQQDALAYGFMWDGNENNTVARAADLSRCV